MNTKFKRDTFYLIIDRETRESVPARYSHTGEGIYGTYYSFENIETGAFKVVCKIELLYRIYEIVESSNVEILYGNRKP